MLLDTLIKPQLIIHRVPLMSLIRMRQEWQEAANGISLLDSFGNVGLMLFDIARIFELTPEEQREFFGEQLYSELMKINS